MLSNTSMLLKKCTSAFPEVFRAVFYRFESFGFPKRDWVVEITHSQYAVRALDWIFQRPIFQTPDFIASAHIPPPTARKLGPVGIHRELMTAAVRWIMTEKL